MPPPGPVPSLRARRRPYHNRQGAAPRADGVLNPRPPPPPPCRATASSGAPRRGHPHRPRAAPRAPPEVALARQRLENPAAAGGQRPRHGPLPAEAHPRPRDARSPPPAADAQYLPDRRPDPRRVLVVVLGPAPAVGTVEHGRLPEAQGGRPRTAAYRTAAAATAASPRRRPCPRRAGGAVAVAVHAPAARRCHCYRCRCRSRASSSSAHFLILVADDGSEAALPPTRPLPHPGGGSGRVRRSPGGDPPPPPPAPGAA